jgi:hypothetical protein
MKSLMVMAIAVLLVLSFSMAGFANQQKAVGNQQMVTSATKGEHRDSGKLEVATGKVASIDPQGKAITITEKIARKEAMDVGTIVNKDTIVKIRGKEATLKDVKVGDTVTIHYLNSHDLYTLRKGDRHGVTLEAADCGLFWRSSRHGPVSRFFVCQVSWALRR